MEERSLVETLRNPALSVRDYLLAAMWLSPGAGLALYALYYGAGRGFRGDWQQPLLIGLVWCAVFAGGMAYGWFRTVAHGRRMRDKPDELAWLCQIESRGRYRLEYTFADGETGAIPLEQPASGAQLEELESVFTAARWGRPAGA